MVIIWNLQNLTHRIVSNKLLVCCQKWFNMRITGSWNSWKREEWVPDIRVETKRLFLPRPVSFLLPKYTSEFTLMLKHLISGHIKRDTDVFMSMELPISIWKWNPVFVTKNQFYYDAHRTCVGVSQSLQPETSSACWANFTMLLFGAATTPQRVALNLVSKFPHAGSARLAIRIAPPQLRDTFIYTAHGCNKEFKVKSGGTHKITCS